MKKAYFLAVLLVISLLTVSFVAAAWYDIFTGRVTTQIPSNTKSCSDSDLGKNYTESGAVKYTWGTWPRIRTNYASDSCEENVLTEYYCTGKQVKSVTYTCSQGCEVASIDAFGQTFNAGKCLPEVGVVPFQNECSDSDLGANATEPGIVIGLDQYGPIEEFDLCVNNLTISEMVCTENNVSKTINLRCVGTAAGKCQTRESSFRGMVYTAAYCQPQEKQCSDTDDGVDEDVAGVATAIVDAYGRPRTERDRCITSKNLREAFCNETTNLTQTVTITCSDVCKNGECITRDVVCVDSDGGKNFTVSGTVTTQYGTVADFCLTDKKLAEFYCTSPSPYKASISMTTRMCKESCSNGVCVGGAGASTGEGANQ